MHLKCGGQEGRQHARTLKKNQENIDKKLVGGSSIIAGVAVRRDLGWRKLEERRKEKKLLFGLRLQRMSEDRQVSEENCSFVKNDCDGWWAEYCVLKWKFGVEGELEVVGHAT